MREIAQFDSFLDAMEAFIEQPWSDGLPCVPPTPALVDQMVAACDRDENDVVGTLASRETDLYVWQAAVCAVMAGCRPEYFPVVLATWEAMFDERFNMRSVLTSSGGAAIVGIVSGPYAETINMNAGTNAFGPGSRANATIGRAIRLGALAILLAGQAELDASAFGHGGKYSFHFAERPPPPGWPSIRQQLGYAPKATTVTVMAADGPRQVAHRWSPTPDGFLRTLAAAMKDPSQNATGCGSAYIVALGPEHAGLLADAGWSPAQIRIALSALSTTSKAELAAAGIEYELAPNHYVVPDATGGILSARPEHILIVTAGGYGSGWSAIVPSYSMLSSSHPATRSVRLRGELQSQRDASAAQLDLA